MIWIILGLDMQKQNYFYKRSFHTAADSTVQLKGLLRHQYIFCPTIAFAT